MSSQLSLVENCNFTSNKSEMMTSFMLNSLAAFPLGYFAYPWARMLRNDFSISLRLSLPCGTSFKSCRRLFFILKKKNPISEVQRRTVPLQLTFLEPY